MAETKEARSVQVVLNINDRALTQEEAMKILDMYDQYELKVFDPTKNEIEILNAHMQVCNIVCYAKKYEYLLNKYNTENIIKIEVETLL